jgi:ribokinase
MAPTSTIAVVGGLVVDLIMVTNRLPDEGETGPSNSYDKALGGKGANAAIAAYRTCHRNPASEDTLKGPASDPEISVKMVGSVGQDEYEEQFAAELKRNGIDVGGVRAVPGMPTSISFVIVEEDSRNNRILCYAGATKVWRQSDFDTIEQVGAGSKPDLVVAVMEMDTPIVEQVILTTGKAGVDMLLNAAPASNIHSECYPYLTHLLINESEAAILSGMELDEVKQETWPEITKTFLRLGVKNVVITLGEAGAYYRNEETTGHVPAFEVTPVDSTGAG